MRESGKTVTVFGVADGRFIWSVQGSDLFGTGSAITRRLRTANRTIGPVLPRARTLNRTTVRFGWVQVRTRVLNRTLPSLIPPPSANLRQLIPPTLAAQGDHGKAIITIIFILDVQSIEMEYVEKHVIVEGMDR